MKPRLETNSLSKRTLANPAAVFSNAPIDLAEAADFYVLCFARAYHEHATRGFLANIRQSLSQEILADSIPERRLVQARVSGELSGTAVGVLRHGRLYVWGVYVHPEHMRKGIGRGLMCQMCADLSTSDTIEVRVISDSKGAVLFYESLGFKKLRSENVEVFPGINLDTDILECPNASFAPFLTSK